jgi:hypothetical protein
MLTIVERDVIIDAHRSSRKERVILVTLLRNLNYLDIFSKNIQISNTLKIRPLGDELCHVDRQQAGRQIGGWATDITKLIITIRNFVNARNKDNE